MSVSHENSIIFLFHNKNEKQVNILLLMLQEKWCMGIMWNKKCIREFLSGATAKHLPYHREIVCSKPGDATATCAWEL